MNLSRVKVWGAEVLYASDLNAEFNNIINHPIANADIAANAAIEGAKLKNADIDLTSKVKGILPVANGGTGKSDDTYDADQVDGIHAAAAATANKLYPLDENAQFPEAVLGGKHAVSDTVFFDDRTAHYTGDGSYVRTLAWKLKRGGTIRIKFDLRADGPDSDAYARIYKNGVAYGTERYIHGITPTTFSEDLAFEEGDMVEFYQKKTAGAWSGIYNMLLCSTLAYTFANGIAMIYVAKTNENPSFTSLAAKYREGLLYVNEQDETLDMYADAAWRELVDWT